MSVLSINPTTTGLVGVIPSVIEIATNNTLEEVLTSGFLTASKKIYGNIFAPTQMALVTTTDEGPIWLKVVVSGAEVSLVGTPSGSVTSVGITGSEFTITNSPITSSGDIGLALKVVTPEKGGTGVANTGTITLGGDFVTSGDMTFNGAFPFIADITGSTNITFPTSGTLVSSNDIIDLAHGGTNAALTASNGGIFYSNATQGQILAGTAVADRVLLSGASAAPIWSTATYPVTTTANQLLYSSAANTIAGLATANNSILATNGTGVPAFTTTIPFNIPVTNLNSGTGASNTTYWRGDGTWDVPPGTGVSSLAGTANEITASAATGAVTLSIPNTFIAPGSITAGNITINSAPNTIFGTSTINISSGTSGIALAGGSSSQISILGSSTGYVVPLAFYNAAQTFAVTFQAANSFGANVNWTLPSADAAGVWQSNGTGTLSISSTINTPNIVGVTNASNAAAGSVGQLVTSNIPVGSATSLVANTAKDVTSISLTAGDWDIHGNVSINGSAQNISSALCWCNTTSATAPDTSMYNVFTAAATTLLNNWGSNTPFLRVNVATTTTVYLSAQANFATGTTTACGSIFARRVR